MRFTGFTGFTGLKVLGFRAIGLGFLLSKAWRLDLGGGGGGGGGTTGCMA